MVGGLTVAAFSQWILSFNYNPLTDIGALPIAGQANAVNQEFAARQANIGFRIQRQQLHRDDIRDLMNLTLGRMDAYNVVGTFLLTLCIAWFSDNTIKDDASLPEWFRALFLISSFTAVGYLIFSVWLAQHASIVAHSIGVRLLISFARLSIPDRAELEKLKVPLIPALEGLKRVAETLGVKSKGTPDGGEGSVTLHHLDVAGSSTGASTLEVPKSKNQSLPLTASNVSSRPASSFASASTTQEPMDAQREVNADQRHFLRFLEEQKRWLSYDAHCRLCMSLGMNQMLQALSYYIVGTMLQAVTSAAFFSFFAVKMVSFVLIQLDTRDDDHNYGRSALLACWLLLPGIFAVLALVLFPENATPLESFLQSLMAAPAFLLQAAWLAYIGFQIQAKRSDSSSDVGGLSLPLQLRTVEYLNVIELEDDGVQVVVQDTTMRALMRKLQDGLDTVNNELGQVMSMERQDGIVSASRRCSADIKKAHERLKRRLGRITLTANNLGNKAAEQEVKEAAQMLDRLLLWQKAADLLATLDSLRNPLVKTKLGAYKNTSVDGLYDDFLRDCEELQLGICGSAAEVSRYVNFNVESKGGAVNIKGPLITAASEMKLVKVEVTNLSRTEWIDTRQDRVLPAPVTPMHYVSYETLDAQMREWEQGLMSFRDTHNQVLAMYPSNDSRYGDLTARSGTSSSNRKDSSSVRMPAATYIAPDEMPGRLVRQFTLACAFWWVVAGAVNFITPFLDKHNLPRMSMQPLQVTWPGPSHLFEVRSLQCQGRNVLVGDDVILYATQWSTTGRLDFPSEVVAAQPVATLCHEHTCESLQPGKNGTSSWRVGSLEPASPFTVDLRELRPSSAIWNCEGRGPPCTSALLAQWDGTNVVVARLHQERLTGQWHVRRRMVVRPGLNPCEEGTGCVREPTMYTDVRALQLSPDGRTLAVLFADLRGSILDAWDLGEGSLLGRWALQGRVRAMCHNSSDILFARQGGGDRSGRGTVVLERTRLPREMLAVSRRSSGL
mmetsp:Transcript_30128/g.80391  ORF Transcript_30128/g.80391 Transcript_30128/m.80391 type:complete len:1008 (-) Transcript_30128:103-3126(-)